MNDQLQIFNYCNRQIRTAGTPERPLFIAKDVCDILDVVQATRAVERLEDDEKGVITVHTPGGEQQMLAVTESGLYALIFTSRKEEAKAFRKWVTSEVLPAIRKTGSYQTGKTQCDNLVQNARLLLQNAEALAAMEKRQEAAEEKIKLLEARQGDTQVEFPDFFTIAAFAKVCGLKLPTKELAKIGKQVARYGICVGVYPKKLEHAVYGTVNTFHRDFLKEVFQEIGIL